MTFLVTVVAENVSDRISNHDGENKKFNKSKQRLRLVSEIVVKPFQSTGREGIANELPYFPFA